MAEVPWGVAMNALSQANMALLVEIKAFLKNKKIPQPFGPLQHRSNAPLPCHKQPSIVMALLHSTPMCFSPVNWLGINAGSEDSR